MSRARLERPIGRCGPWCGRTPRRGRLAERRKRYRGLDQPPKYVSPTLTYNYHRDYGLKAEQRVSLLTLDGRMIVPCTGFARHLALIQQGAQRGISLGAAKLWYDKPRKQFDLFVSLESMELEVTEPTPATHQHIVGVDVGQRYPAVATDTHNHTMFHSGKAARAKADHYARLRKRLQHQGTRAATRRLIVLAGRERRLKHERNHIISRRIVDVYPHAHIGLADLTHIGEQVRRTHGKQARREQRRANRHASQWAFAELHKYVAYKAVLVGSMAVKVDAYKTSQACPRCGYMSEDNRPEKGLPFGSQACHLMLHADLVGRATSRCERCLPGKTVRHNGRLVSTPRCVGQ